LFHHLLAAYAAVRPASRGYPRAVNRLAAAAPLATSTTRKTIADTTAVHAAITEVNDQCCCPS
jgi:type II secretory pathway predicted ATPase ExeA